jgi:hypothetical protein
VDTSHETWVLDQKALVPPDAIICADLQLEECSRHTRRYFWQTAEQHRSILALLKAIGPAAMTRITSRTSAGARTKFQYNEFDADDEDKGKCGGHTELLTAWTRGS